MNLKDIRKQVQEIIDFKIENENLLNDPLDVNTALFTALNSVSSEYVKEGKTSIDQIMFLDSNFGINHVLVGVYDDRETSLGEVIYDTFISETFDSLIDIHNDIASKTICNGLGSQLTRLNRIVENYKDIDLINKDQVTAFKQAMSKFKNNDLLKKDVVFLLETPRLLFDLYKVTRKKENIDKAELNEISDISSQISLLSILAQSKTSETNEFSSEVIRLVTDKFNNENKETFEINTSISI